MSVAVCCLYLKLNQEQSVGNPNTALRAADFDASIGINTHMNYTDGAYANVSNVQADLAYLGISLIRDGMPNPSGGIPYYNQVSAFETLAKAGIRFDLVTGPGGNAIASAEQQIQTQDNATANAVYAVEGPNEINNWPVTYNGLTGIAAATAYQSALYSALKGSAATSAIDIYNFTGGLMPILLGGGTYNRNSDGSYTVTNGQLGFHVTLPTGVSTITMNYTGAGSATPSSGLFGYPAQNQQSSCYAGKNGVIKYTYDNTSGAPKTVYADFIDYGATAKITNVKITGPGSNTNLITFDPNLSLAGQANAANVHMYPNNGGSIGSSINGAFLASYGSVNPGPRVITETGFTTDPNTTAGVTQTVQAQQITNGLLEAYKAGVSTTYLYELLDEKADPNNTNSEMHFGLFNNNNTPKLAAIAVHNLTSLLADTGSTAKTFTAGTLNYTATGANAGDQSMLFEKSTGEFDIALWNDGFAGGSSTDSVKLTLGTTFQSVSVFDLLTGTETSFSNVSQLTVALGGDPLLVQIDSAAVNAAKAMSFAQPAATAATAASWATTWAPTAPATAVAAASPIPTVAAPAPLAAALNQTTQTSPVGNLVTQIPHHHF